MLLGSSLVCNAILLIIVFLQYWLSVPTKAQKVILRATDPPGDMRWMERLPDSNHNVPAIERRRGNIWEETALDRRIG